jgi:hypothetical protein
MTATPDPALDAIRFPVGRYKATPGVDMATRRTWFDDIERAPDKVAHVVHGLSSDQLLTPYRDGGWTVAQVVHHLADSHMNAYIRTRFVLAEPNFTVKPYDENRWSQFVDAESSDIAPSLGILRGLHVRWVTLLRSLHADDFARQLHHPERGPMTLDSLTQLYAWHGRHHAAHISGLKTRKGWA